MAPSCLHPRLPLAYNVRHLLSAPSTNSANSSADPEDTPSREGNAGQRKACDVQHRFKPHIIGRDANVALGRGSPARATATPAAFFAPAGAAFRLFATASPRTVAVAEGKAHLCHGDDGHAALSDRLAEHGTYSQFIYHLLDRLEVGSRLVVHSTTSLKSCRWDQYWTLTAEPSPLEMLPRPSRQRRPDPTG